jgi:glutathionyl-hydroquinone reductase
MAKSPHDSDSFRIDVQHEQGRILATELNMLNSEVKRIETELNSELDAIDPSNLRDIDGKIIATIVNEIESGLTTLKTAIDEHNYNSSSNGLFKQIEELDYDLKSLKQVRESL